MGSLDLTKIGVRELNASEMVEVNGGWIFIAWGAMLAMDAITVGMYYGYHQIK